MAASSKDDATNPARHFDYHQLLEKKKNQNVVLIDVRELAEINETGKLPGSIHIPMGDLKKALSEMTPEEFKKLYGANQPKKDQELIFSCKSGNRSQKALQLGLDMGYTKSGHYKGGWMDWAEKVKKEAGHL